MQERNPMNTETETPVTEPEVEIVRCHECGEPLVMSEYGVYNSCGDCFGGKSVAF
jgi:formylmethanofuran dehydrogenase subunit E